MFCTYNNYVFAHPRFEITEPIIIERLDSHSCPSTNYQLPMSQWGFQSSSITSIMRHPAIKQNCQRIKRHSQLFVENAIQCCDNQGTSTNLYTLFIQMVSKVMGGTVLAFFVSTQRFWSKLRIPDIGSVNNAKFNATEKSYIKNKSDVMGIMCGSKFVLESLMSPATQHYKNTTNFQQSYT